MYSNSLQPPSKVVDFEVSALQGLQLGVVTAIAAPAALRVTFRGGGGHAGALLMHRRADVGLAAAELALHVESATLAHGEWFAKRGILLMHNAGIAAAWVSCNHVPDRYLVDCWLLQGLNSGDWQV